MSYHILVTGGAGPAGRIAELVKGYTMTKNTQYGNV